MNRAMRRAVRQETKIRTSIGFHTFTMSILFSWIQAKELLDIFKQYSKVKKITKCHGIGEERRVSNPDGTSCILYPRYEIQFTEWGRGITWLISFIKTKKVFMYGKIDVIFNPRLLFGENN